MKSVRGMTLIELLIVMVIVAILSAIAVPSYQDYVMRGRLPEAAAELSATRVKLEQYFQDNRTYVGACAAGTVAPLPANTPQFTYACPTLTATTFSVAATGVAAGGTGGFVFDIDQNNVRRTTGVHAGWTLPAQNCWVRRKDGSC